MEPVSFTEMLKQFGPYGICLFLMGSGLIYLTRWLREERKATDVMHEGIRSQFLSQLNDQRSDYTSSLKQVTTDFRDAMKEQNIRIDGLSSEVKTLDGHVQELRMR